MDLATFAAQRAQRLVDTDEYLRPVVEDGLARLLAGDPDWDEDIVAAADIVWFENHQAEAPGAGVGQGRSRFRAQLHTTLDHTTDTGFEVDQAQVDRITNWLSTYAVNAGTTAGAYAKGVRYKRWTAMDDQHTRETHVLADGQLRPIGSTFTVGGAKLAYPGDPSGPLDEVLNCRCVVIPASREGEAMSTNTYLIGPDDDVVYTYGHDEPDDDNPDVVPGEKAPPVRAAAVSDPADIAVEPPDEEDLVADEPDDGEELITEVPVHGVAIVEGRPTGDGRGFRKGSLTFDDTPQPLGYEFEHSHGGDNSRVAIVGRIDEIFRKEGDDVNEIRWRGSIILTKAHANEALESIMDGSYNGSSVIIDDVTLDVEEMKAEMRANLAREDEGGDLIDEFIGDGTTPVTWVAAGRQRRLDMVPTGAFIESRIGLGHAFDDELTDEERDALVACGCTEADPGLAGYEEEFKDYPTEDRKRMADSGTAMPDGSYPIADCDDLRNAIQAIGRAKDPDATKAHIRKRKSALGCSDVELPENWSLEFAPGTKDGPGWITHPVPTSRIRRYWTKGEGAAKIRWGQPGDFNRCRSQLAKYIANPEWLAGTCANMHKEALGYWPATHAKAVKGSASPVFSFLAAATTTYPAEFFTEPEMPTPVGFAYDGERVWGYVAEWGACHIGVPGVCRDAPHSTNDYAWFRRGVVDTTAGEQSVGVLTYADTGHSHASERARLMAAMDHYDRPDAVRAYINVGENDHGIWFSGVRSPRCTDEMLEEMRAVGAFSGDWRDVRQNGLLELIGFAGVATSGLPVPARIGVEGGRQVSLIASANIPREPKVVSYTLTLSEESVAAITRNAIREMRHQERVELAMTPARERVRRERLAAARSRVGGE